MKTLTVVGVLIIALAVALPAAADVQDYGDLYYRISPPANVGDAWDPVGPNRRVIWPVAYTNHTVPIQMPEYYGNGWISTGGPVAVLSGKTLKKDSLLLLGFENWVVAKNVKYVTVRIRLTDITKTLAVDSFKAGVPNGLSFCEKVWEGITDGEYVLVIKINPQPNWSGWPSGTILARMSHSNRSASAQSAPRGFLR